MAGKHRHWHWKGIVEILFSYGGIFAGIPLAIIDYVMDNRTFAAIGSVWAVAGFLWFMVHD